MSFTIILPVYGDSPWIDEAVESVINQLSNEWELLIADDGSNLKTEYWLNEKINYMRDSRIKWVKRERNLGLFRNLNRAIEEAKTEWVVLLCSDDRLEEHAINSLLKLREEWPQADLILSSFVSINADGSSRPDDSGKHHKELSEETNLIQPVQMIPELLRLGSLNGNLTGMAFSKLHWQASGQFREDWRHAADWEWLIRASEGKALLLNRTPLAAIRTHSKQLSVANRLSGHECEEVATVVTTLLRHPLVQNEPQKWAWAGHVMQFQLWNLMKAASQGDWSRWPTGLLAIHKSAGVRQTCRSLVRWLPNRWEAKRIQRSN